MNPIVELPTDAINALKKLRPNWHVDAVAKVGLLPGGYTNDNYSFTYQGADYVLRVVRQAPVAIDRAFEKRLLSGPIALLTAPVVAFVLP